VVRPDEAAIPAAPGRTADGRLQDGGQRHDEHDGCAYLEHERNTTITAELAKHAEKTFSAVSAISVVKRPGT
jgi:hypothetical protein